MKERKAAILMRMRARHIGQYEEMLRLTVGLYPTLDERVKMVRLKGHIASTEERLRQGGYGWPGKDDDDETLSAYLGGRR